MVATTNKSRKPLKMEVTGGGLSRLERMRARLADAPAAPSDKPSPSGNTDTTGRRIVPINKLVENPGNERKTFRGMDGIKATVEAFGILEPPTVEPQSDGNYLLVTGHRRARAAKELGHETIEVLVRSADDAVARRRKSIVSNVHHQDVDAIELAEGLQALLDEDAEITSQADLAAAIGKSRAWVSETIGILRLKPALQVKVKAAEKQLPYDAISKIARLALDQQEPLIDDLIGGAGVMEIRARIASQQADAGKRKSSKSASRRRGTEIRIDVGDNVTVAILHLPARATKDDQRKALQAALAHLDD